MSYVAGSELGPGTRVSGYRVETLIGRGGMGAVYRAEEEGLGRKVALKVIAPELAQDERFRERFLRESRIAASLDHPHVIPIYQAGEEQGLLYLAMRYVEGTDLAKLVAEEGALEPRRALELLSQVAEALDAAHERGLVHRDVKPSNVLIAEAAGREHCYLGDFGLTKRTGSLSGVSVAGNIVGTLEYVAPEQITGEPLDERSDVYSLGCVLYECLTGQAPFPRATDVALLWAHVHEEPTPPSKARPELPRELDTVLARGLAKEPEQRYRSAGELLAAARSDASPGGKAGFDAAAHTNLPRPPSSFVGREAELLELVGMLRAEDLKLLTLTGPGGTGKTRLAVQAAVESSESFPDGLWWVGLASLRDPHRLASSLAQALSVEEEPGREIAETVADRLRGERALLLVDNAEHLLPGIADEVAWLRDIEGPIVLVTSRERLQLQGERVYPVPSLEEIDGVELFVERARALGDDVRASPAVTELCARLDNLPLALELAAARTIVFSPEQLLERLSEALDMRAGRDADPRQRTLRATIEWSYDLLEDRERQLFRGMSVFPGATFEAAKAVCQADPDTLQSLLDKSLLRRTTDERSRYWMLATIREFAGELLRAEQEDGVVRDRHADYYLALARSANLAMEDMGPQRHELVIPERDNLRAALGWALESDARELGLDLVVALENYWATSSPHEGAEWAALLLDASGEAPAQLVSRALRLLGGMQNQMGRSELAEGSWQRAIDLARASGDERGVAILLHRLAHVALQRGDLKAVRALAEESLAGHRRSGFPKGVANALTSLADVARAEGAYEDALELLAEAREICEEIGFRWWLSGVLANIAAVSLELGRLEDARASAQKALALSQAMHDRKAIVYELALLAELAAASGDRTRAGVLWGAVEAENARAPAGRWIHGRVDPERVLVYADAEFEQGRGVGQAMAFEDAIAFALDEWAT